ncbi:MAG: dihydroorotase [Clostridia bacterium]|nr:dihydroorotase [Clostridia bacterium]
MNENTRVKIFKSALLPSFSPDLTACVKDLTLSEKDEVFVFPGFADVHVHLREPGFSYKETILSGTMAAARGGYTAVAAMPNLSPVPDSVEHLKEELAIIEKDAVIDVYPYASITVGEKGEALSDIEGMAEYAFAYSDDGKGVASENLMREAMLKAKKLGKMIVAHEEDLTLVNGGYIHAGAYAKAHGHKGISSESEWAPIARDLRLAKETGCAFHVCHVSTKESVEVIRKAKREGVNVTCETAPHYLLLSDKDLKEDGRFKMNPPLRSEEDRLAMIEGILDGTVDMIATDHAPHSYEEKAKGLEKSAFGVVGIETAFASLYTGLVKPGILSLEKLVELLTIAPGKRFGIPMGEDYTVWNLSKEFTVDPAEFLSKGKATPFEGMKMNGVCLKTVHNGQTVYHI